ncbi:MAG: HAD-IA family hydrolase [Halobacteria archaeon]|nr:HAD-IA family hydrolase [Halobacteria archaeon]
MTEDGIDAVVYDLDGTLVRLNVDWDAVKREVADSLADESVEITTFTFRNMLDKAQEAGIRAEVEGIINRYEERGAQDSDRLPAADDLVNETRPIGVCSLNCESACQVALERHGLHEHVDAIVGRNTVGAMKPDPSPLLETVRRLSVTPERALFIGDSDTDKLTAERAGVVFRYV